MKIKILTFVAVIALVSALPAQEGGKWVDLFDGKTLKGWTQLNGTAPYAVKDGTITGQTKAGSPNSFLCTDKLYGDFELEFEVKCDPGLNSGVQIRSTQKAPPAPKADAKAKEGDAKADAKAKKAKKAKQPTPEGRVNGPQIEIENSPGQSGFIYGEATGLKWLSPEPGSKDEKVNKHSHFKEGEWNKFRVIAKGPRIQTFINGAPVADLTHEETYKTHPKGFIGLQVHGIGQRTDLFNVAWRNIRIKEIK